MLLPSIDDIDRFVRSCQPVMIHSSVLYDVYAPDTTLSDAHGLIHSLEKDTRLWLLYLSSMETDVHIFTTEDT